MSFTGYDPALTSREGVADQLATLTSQRWLAANPEAIGPITIAYKRDGKVQWRAISPLSVSLVEQEARMDAFCHLRGGQRTFKVSSVAEAFDADGVAIDDLAQFLLDAFYPWRLDRRKRASAIETQPENPLRVRISASAASEPRTRGALETAAHNVLMWPNHENLPEEPVEMPLTTEQLLLLESRVDARSKSTALAYLLWFFLGVLSIHRFYLGRPKTAILQIILNCIVIGLLWTLADAFLIPGLVRAYNDNVRDELIARVATGR